MLGYPILSMRSFPGCGVARPLLREDLKAGRIETPLEVHDVWPENYSANSVQKVWAAKFAARHPNVVVLDLSSFKCGHDAPTYGLIDCVSRRRRRRTRRCTTSTPTSRAARSRSASRPTPTRSSCTKSGSRTGAPQRRAEVPHGREAAAAARAEAPAARGAQAAGPALEAMIIETKAKVAEYSASSRPTCPKPNPSGQGRGPGAARIKKRVDDREIVARV